MRRKPKIVCLGGGNAMPKAVLGGLKRQPVNLSVVCAMLDSGGSSGRLRWDYKIVAPGDIRRALIALSEASPIMGELFNYRFQSGELAGHNFANLLITALELSNHSNYQRTINFLRKTLNIRHQVFPATIEKSEVCAVLENGRIVRGETNIDRPDHNGWLKIKKVYLEPPARAYPAALKAISRAEMVIIGPGDLYSTLAQILLIKGMAEAIVNSRAKKVYICNLMTKWGETNAFSVADFSGQIEDWLGKELDIVLYNDFIPPLERIEKYRQAHPEFLDMVRIDENLSPTKFLGRKLVRPAGPLEHDSQQVSSAILSLL
jgi:uncharacterized cofD-like protein